VVPGAGIEDRLKLSRHHRITLSLIFGVGLSLSAQTDSREPLSAKEIKRAEAEAKTAADHLRLAAWYRAKAAQAQANLAEAEAEAQRYSGMATRSKIPNPYWSAENRASQFRREYKDAMKRASAHRKLAESLQ
jgi:hypothetical protein